MYSKFKIILILSLFLALTFPKTVNAQVVINEFSPKSPEWVEIFNKGNSEVNLDSYYFDDDTDFNSDSGTSTKIKLQGFFPANSLCYLDINTFLNDDGDSPTLFNSNGEVLDTYTYPSAVADLSYSRIPDGGDWQIDTPFSKTQNSCLNLQTPTPTPTQEPTSAPPTKSPSPTPTVKPTPTKTASPKPTPTKSPTPTASPTDESSSIETIKPLSIATSTPVGLVAGTSTTKKSPLVAIIFISLGVLFLGYCGYLIYNQKHATQTTP